MVRARCGRDEARRDAGRDVDGTAANGRETANRDDADGRTSGRVVTVMTDEMCALERDAWIVGAKSRSISMLSWMEARSRTT